MNTHDKVEQYDRKMAERQKAVKRTGELWAIGRKGCGACIGVSFYGDALVATYEADRLTANQAIRALKTVWPDWHYAEVKHDFGYGRIDGREPTR